MVKAKEKQKRTSNERHYQKNHFLKRKTKRKVLIKTADGNQFVHESFTDSIELKQIRPICHCSFREEVFIEKSN